jgi:hypothetical protein
MKIYSTAGVHPALINALKNPPALKRDYLEPFRDYPKYHLSHASAEDAARFCVGYATAHVRHSPNMDLLGGELTKKEAFRNIVRLDNVRERIAQELGLPEDDRSVMDLYSENFGSDKFIHATDIIAAERVGNCGELAWVAARALAEFGCPHPVVIIQIEGTLSNGEAVDHNLVKIVASKDTWYADPFFHLLNESQRKKLTGSADCPSYWPELGSNGKMNAPRFLHVTSAPLGHSNPYDITLHPYRELLKVDDNGKPIHAITASEIFEVHKSADGRITVDGI